MFAEQYGDGCSRVAQMYASCILLLDGFEPRSGHQRVARAHKRWGPAAFGEGGWRSDRRVGAQGSRADQFADWVERSGIKLVPRSWHPISERLMVVEADATVPESKAPTRVATVFRVSHGKVTASPRLPELREALEPTYICREIAARE